MSTPTPRIKEAIKTALAMTIAYGIALSMDWPNPHWAGFAVAFISLSTVGQSLNKGVMRILWPTGTREQLNAAVRHEAGAESRGLRQGSSMAASFRSSESWGSRHPSILPET